MKQAQTLKTLYEQQTKRLAQNNIEEAKIDAMWLLLHVFDYTKLDYLLKCYENPNPEVAQKYIKIIDRRLTGEPVQYIIGVQEFMGLTFNVNPNVLIPRQDTEVLVETIINTLEKKEQGLLLDIGTGSGCIIISLIKHMPGFQGIGLDISESALKVAKRNSELNQVNDKIQWIKSDLFNDLGHEYHGKLTCIVSNPPYIPTGDINDLMIEVKNYEPTNALDGGADGLDYYRNISSKAYEYLEKGGMLFYEVGHDQAYDVKRIMLDNGYENIHIVKDLAGINRIVYGTK